MEAFLRSLPNSLAEKPKAILVVSGHWETDGFAFTGAERPELIYDYYNFPPVPISCATTCRAHQRSPPVPRLSAQGCGHPLVCRPEAGPGSRRVRALKVAFPDADIPLIEMSVERGLDPALHVAAGRASRRCVRKVC
jgi:aromatic ring-opening dioxygenase catalytic subunit (LigB family)